MRSVIIIGSKEVLDHARDFRSLVSTGLYALMGPAVVCLLQAVSADALRDPERNAALISVFVLLSAFSGATAFAADTIAGERERRSLLPLLISGVTLNQTVTGKWLAACVFSILSCWLTLLAFAGISVISATMPALSSSVLYCVANLVCLAMLAAALQLLISTACRSVKEASSYLMIVIFIAMGLSMWGAFSQAGGSLPWSVLPVVGDQRMLQQALAGEAVPLHAAATLGAISMALTAAMIALTARLFGSERIVYGT